MSGQSPMLPLFCITVLVLDVLVHVIEAACASAFDAGVARGREIERMDIASHRVRSEFHFDDGPSRLVYANDPFDAIERLVRLSAGDARE